MSNILDTFEAWLSFQVGDPTGLSTKELAQWRKAYDAAVEKIAATPKVGRMKLAGAPGTHFYAVVRHESNETWLSLVVRRNPDGQIFVLIPRSDKEWDAHTSYHKSGDVHAKSHKKLKLSVPRKQPPAASTFRGTETLGVYLGFAGKSVGATFDPADFTGHVVLPDTVAGSRSGAVAIDLVEPGVEPMPQATRTLVSRHLFTEVEPHLVISILNL